MINVDSKFKRISNMFGYVLAEDMAGGAADTRKVKIFLIIDDLC